MQHIIIAIDGFSSTGKSTLAKRLAQHLKFTYIDSGAMYRAVTYFALRHQYISKDHFNINDFVLKLDRISLDFILNKKTVHADIYLNNKNVEQQIRTMEVSRHVSQIASIAEVRYQLVKQQQYLGKDRSIVMDGRDIGTVVFPNAHLKLFITASPDVRAKRRFDELLNRGEAVTFKEVLHNIKERDYIDSHRQNSPLVKAQDAVVIDSTNLTLDEQYHKALQLVKMVIEDYE